MLPTDSEKLPKEVCWSSICLNKIVPSLRIESLSSSKRRFLTLEFITSMSTIKTDLPSRKAYNFLIAIYDPGHCSDFCAGVSWLFSLLSWFPILRVGTSETRKKMLFFLYPEEIKRLIKVLQDLAHNTCYCDMTRTVSCYILVSSTYRHLRVTREPRKPFKAADTLLFVFYTCRYGNFYLSLYMTYSMDLQIMFLPLIKKGWASVFGAVWLLAKKMGELRLINWWYCG